MQQWPGRHRVSQIFTLSGQTDAGRAGDTGLIQRVRRTEGRDGPARGQWLAAASASTRAATIAFVTIAALCFVACAAVPTDVSTEALLALPGCAVVILLARRARTGWLRGLLLMICLLLTLRYFAWRISETIVFFDPFSFAACLLLLLAEIHGLAMMLLGLFVNVSPITRALDPRPLDAADPRVDVLIPSYNEGTEMLAVTICAATQIDYPAGRLQVHLLDDGGTDGKCADANPAKAAAACARRAELQALCARFGATYRTRLGNDHAKAGNINFALPHLDGDLVLILDADHVPTADILARTVPFYRHDPKLFLVQTPHFFMNPDTIEKNLDLFLKMPGENEMFHRAIQSGLDFWNSAIFVGSAAIIHRARLLEVGGIATNTITEDAETALALHARGYSSAYVARPMIAGLAPETFTGLVTQRVRWGQGMIQILLLENPLWRRGLTLAQRFGYLSSTLYWLFPYSRVVFVAAPVAFLVFGLKIYAANVTGILVFVVPHMLASYVSNSTLFQRFRWPVISHVYETLLGMLMLRPLTATLRRPRAPDFKVTPKGEQLDADFVSPLVRPFYVIFAITLTALPFGIWRIWTDAEHRNLVMITMGWEVFNLLVLIAALGALFERKQRRTVPRLRANMAAWLIQAGAAGEPRRIPGRITNLSMGGLRFVAAPGEAAPEPTAAGGWDIEIVAPHAPEPVRLRVRLRAQRGAISGLAFDDDPAQFRQVVALVHGDSGRWVGFWDEAMRGSGVLRAMAVMGRTGFAALGSHIMYLFRRLRSHRLMAAIKAVAPGKVETA